MGRFAMTSHVNALLGYTSTYDTSIQTWLPYMPGRVCAICNNYFPYPLAYVKGGDFTFTAATSIRTAEDSFTTDGRLAAGDDIYIKGTLRNDGFYVLSAVTSVLITIDEAVDYSKSAVISENIDTEDLYDVTISLVMFPDELKPIVANMIRYDMIERVNKKGIQSERIGNYSVAYKQASALGFNYPDDIIGGLESIHKSSDSMIQQFYTEHATVIQWTETINEVGGSNEMATTYTSISNITLALEQLSKNERFVAGTDKIIGTHRAYADITTTITEIHGLIIGAHTYNIKSVENPMQMNHHYEMILELIQ